MADQAGWQVGRQVGTGAGRSVTMETNFVLCPPFTEITKAGSVSGLNRDNKQEYAI